MVYHAQIFVLPILNFQLPEIWVKAPSFYDGQLVPFVPARKSSMVQNLWQVGTKHF
ncbi:hypothetical protein [Anabaena sp. CCY 9402-a]|uniref:hypothetical protein n=1 Tax=Anabaena sp. CCY 9402-a TaxID=3103867 RepID=UPI0039C67AA2